MIMKRMIYKFILPSFAMTLAACFMLLIYEPLVLYANNTSIFWFDLYDILPILVSMFFAGLAVMMAICAVVYIFCGKVIKRPNWYNYFLAACFYLFLILYLHGNFLAGSLPNLDGATFNYSDYPVYGIISNVLLVAILGLIVFLVFRLKADKFIKIVTILSGIILVMLTVSLSSNLASKSEQAFENKNNKVATFEHYNDASSERNFFIFMVDTIDSSTIDRLLRDDKNYQETLKDFTYFPDTTSYYPFTLHSMPLIFSQTPRKDEANFEEYSKNAFKNSPILNSLYNDGYKMLLYDYELVMSGETADRFENMAAVTKIDETSFKKELARYVAFKYLPFIFKDKVKIEEINFYESAPDYEVSTFRAYDKTNYDIYTKEPINIVEDKVFHFIHLEGAHQPLNLDENLKRINPPRKGTYEQKVLASFKIIQAYLDRLKAAGVYDNASIVIMSDHGYNDIEDYNKITEEENVVGCFNPMLYIKGVNESHDEMVYSDKPISQIDFGEAFEGLRQGKKSTELFSGISYPRERIMVQDIGIDGLTHLKEFKTEGPAWEKDKVVATGNELVVQP